MQDFDGSESDSVAELALSPESLRLINSRYKIKILPVETDKKCALVIGAYHAFFCF